MDCGQRFHPAAMDFDHRPGEGKLYTISTMKSTARAAGLLEAELAKCDLVCSNCHRVRTYDRSLVRDRPSSGLDPDALPPFMRPAPDVNESDEEETE